VEDGGAFQLGTAVHVGQIQHLHSAVVCSGSDPIYIICQQGHGDLSFPTPASCCHCAGRK
jgi:hypothetical protein